MADPRQIGDASPVVDAPPVADVRRVAVIGTGTIGGGWAVHFLRRGYDVVAYDPGPDAERRLRAQVSGAWPAVARLGLAPGASPERLTFAAALAQALAEAEFVQESTPEHLDAKIRVLAEIDEATAPGVVIASSTSGFAMTDMQVQCRTPQRLVVGHPFNPPYLIPLVEVVGGKATGSEAVAWADRFYAHTGKVPLKLERELPGFVANRVQEALWYEALNLVAAGEATVDQIDAAVTYGPGLRWALMGPCLTFHLAGGPGGMAAMLDHFGPHLTRSWTHNTAPEVTADLRERMVTGCEAEAAGHSVADLVRERDDFLVELSLLLERHAAKWGRRRAGTP
jgi:carnitine 3-dehydrogenase